jgi:RimJ/RimL family protein N-acetyltransferase
MVRERVSDRLIGYLGLSIPTFLPQILPVAEVGWRLHPDAGGKGYATEGGRAALREVFTSLGLPEVCSLIQTENLASIRVAERLGMGWVRTTVVPPRPGRAPVEVAVLLLGRDNWRHRQLEA